MFQNPEKQQEIYSSASIVKLTEPKLCPQVSDTYKDLSLITMSSRYRDPTLKESKDNSSRRRQLLGQRSKTMVEESSTSRYKEDSAGLGRRYGSARYHRTTVDLPIRATSPTGTYQAKSTVDPSSPRKYRTSSTTPEQPFKFTRASSMDYSSYSKTSRNPVHHDFASHGVDSDRSKKHSTGLRSPPTGRSSSSYTSKYTPTDLKLSTSPPPYHYSSKDREESSSRSSSISSRGSSGSTSRKSSTSSVGRDKISYVGRTSPDVTTSQDISRLSQKIARTFDKDGRRESDSSTSPQRRPFLRSYSLRSDYTSRYAQHQLLGRTSSSPSRTSIAKQSSLPENTSTTLPKDTKVERSRKASWLQSQKPDNTDKGSFSKVLGGKERSGSSSPSEQSAKPSFTGKLSSSNESNTDNTGGIYRGKFSVPSKYFSSRETISRESSEGSTEVLDTTGPGKTRKKYSLPTKLGLIRRRSSSIEGSKSAPASPDRYQDILRARSTSVDADSEKDHSKGSVMRRFKFWDKKERRSPRSRSISPEGRQSADEQLNTTPVEQPSLDSSDGQVDNQDVQVITDAIKSLETTAKEESVEGPDQEAIVKVVSQKIDTTDSQARKLSRDERRARYRRGHNTVYSKSMDAAVNTAVFSNELEAEDTTNNETEMQTSEKLRERRRLRRIEREKFFASESITGDSNKPTRQKLKLSVSTEDSGVVKQRSKTISSSAHQDIIESILKEQPHLSREEIRPPSVKEMLKRFICEDDTSKTILDSRKTKDEGRPHTICGGTLSPDEMRKFEDINFSLARRYSSDDFRPVKTTDKDVSSTSDVEGKDMPLNTTETESKIPIETKVEKSAAPSKTGNIIRRLSLRGEEDTHHRSLFRRRKISAEQEEKEKERKEMEKEKLKELEREKKLREKEEKERKERQRQKDKEEKEEKTRKEKEEKTRKDKEDKLRKEKEEKSKKEKEEKTKKDKEEKIKKDKEEKSKKDKEEKIKKEKEEKTKRDKEEKAKKEKSEKEKKDKEEKVKKEHKEKHIGEKEKSQEEVKEKKEKRDKDQKERLKDKEKRQQGKKERKDRKIKLREEQKEKTQLHMELLGKRSVIQAEDNEVTSVDGVEKRRGSTDETGQSDLPREGSVSALLGLFSQADQMEKPRHPLRFQKVRPRTLAAGIAPEIMKTAREMMERREKFNAACHTQDDSSINTRPDSLIEEQRFSPSGDTNLDNRLADKNEEDRKNELRRCK